MKKIFIFTLLVSLLTIKTLATTWNEPWTDKVIKEANYFVLAKVQSFDEEKGVNIKIIRQLGGDKITDEITITGFYLLGLTSSSGGHGGEFHFEGVGESYFFIKKNDSGAYCIATPTAGFDYIKDNKVYATYRHSYHQALVPIETYEMTMTAIFNNYHNLGYDKEKIISFITTQLSKKPAGFDEAEVNTFFLQHVALETIYHLQIPGFYDSILPFFNDTKNFHNRASAARALIGCNTELTKKLLLNKIAKNKDDDFTTVLCIWTLTTFKPTELKSELQKMIKRASTKENGFGGNIMDPRVGTHFPDVKAALEDLVKTL